MTSKAWIDAWVQENVFSKARVGQKLREMQDKIDTLTATKEMNKKCVVRECPNISDQGTFIGDLCFPCHAALAAGMIGDLRVINAALDAFVDKELDRSLKRLAKITADMRKARGV